MFTKLQESPLAARLKLTGDLWDSIAADQGVLLLTNALKKLDNRLDEFEADGDQKEPAATTLKAIRHSL